MWAGMWVIPTYAPQAVGLDYPAITPHYPEIQPSGGRTKVMEVLLKARYKKAKCDDSYARKSYTVCSFFKNQFI